MTAPCAKSTVRQQHQANITAHHIFSPPNTQPSPAQDMGQGWLQQRSPVFGNIIKLLTSDAARADILLLQDWAHPISEKECPPISEASALGQITDTDYTSKCKPSLLNWTGTPTPHTLSLYVGWPSSHLLDTTSS